MADDHKRAFRLVNRAWPKKPGPWPAGGEMRVVVEATANEPRRAPAYFAIAPGVLDAAAEHALRFETFGETRLDSSFIAQIPEGRVISGGFFVADRDDDIHADSFRAFGSLLKEGFRDLGSRNLSRPRSSRLELREPAVVLGVQTNRNYFHWLMEALPRLWLARDQCMLEGRRVLVPALQPWMERMAAVCGVFPDQMLVPPADELICEDLLMPARGLWNINTFTPHAFALVAELAGRAEPVVRQRLFVSRQRAASRRIVNEDEIFDIAAQFGFIRVFPEAMSFEEQIETFASAEAVAGALGAGLANAAFMPAGAALIEFSPEGREADAVLFANLAHHRGLPYAGVVGPFSDAPERAFGRRNFRVPADLARRAFGATC